MTIIINKRKISGCVTAPASKSVEQRLLAASLLSRQECLITQAGDSDDVIAARNILAVLGAKCELVGKSISVIPTLSNESNTIHCNESGLCARMFAPIAALFLHEYTITGRNGLLNRPIATEFSVLKQMGCIIESNDYLPVKISNAQIISGQYIVDGSKSSQFISGLIMSLAVVYGNSEVIVKNAVSTGYILLTIMIMKNFGINVEYEFESQRDLIIKIEGGQKYKQGTYEVEGDWSGASNILVLGALCADQEIAIKNLSKTSVQADKNILRVFDNANIKYFWKDDALYVQKSEAKSFNFNANNCPDLIPALVVLALFADGESIISGANRLLTKESSRAEVLISELGKCNADLRLEGNDIIVNGKQNYSFAKLNPHGDHRMAMAFAVFGACSDAGLEIENPEVVKKSWPEFWDVLRSISIVT